MNDANIMAAIEALGEVIKNLNTDIYVLKLENERLKEQLKKKEAGNG